MGLWNPLRPNCLLPHSTAPTTFPNLTPDELLDVQIDIDPAFVVSLLCCLLENHPAIPFPPGAAGAVQVQSANGTGSATITGIWLCLGLLTFQGNLSVVVQGQTGQPKTVD